MTKKERAQYASLCSHLQAEARKNGTQYTKPDRPDANTLDSWTCWSTLREYQRIAGYLLSSLIEMQERLKTI